MISPGLQAAYSMKRTFFSRECKKCGSATLGFFGKPWHCSNGCGTSQTEPEALAPPIEVQLTVAELQRLEELAVVQGGTVSDVVSLALAAYAKGGRYKPPKD